MGRLCDTEFTDPSTGRGQGELSVTATRKWSFGDMNSPLRSFGVEYAFVAGDCFVFSVAAAFQLGLQANLSQR